MKGCGVPSKGNARTRKHANSHSQLVVIVLLSLFLAEGVALKPRKCDTRRTAGRMFQFRILAALSIAVALFICITGLQDCTAREVRIHLDGGFLQWTQLCCNSANTIMYQISEAGVLQHQMCTFSTPVCYLYAGAHQFHLRLRPTRVKLLLPLLCLRNHCI